jgi:hypothetical protein
LKRSTSPGRSSPSVKVRSMVRFGPATSMAGRATAREARHYAASMSAAYRLNRLFHPDSGRCIDVAVDHGLFGEAALHAGIEDMAAAIDTLVAAGPEAIQLAPGIELRADLIKAHTTDDLNAYHRIVTAAGARAPERREPRRRHGGARADARAHRAGRGRDRLRPQRHPAPRSRRDGPRPAGDRARRAATDAAAIELAGVA